MKFRAIIATLFTTLMLALSSLVSAQDVDLCFGLAQADCDAITAAYATEVNSFTQDFSINFSLTGLPAEAGGDITFNVSGVGPFAVDLSKELPVEMALPMNVSFSGPDGSGEGSIEIRIVDGFVYIQNPEDTSEWIGVNALEAANDPSLTGGLGLPLDPASLTEADAEALMADLPIDEDTLALIDALAAVPGFLAYERAGDTYTFTADVGALITAPEFNQALETIGELTGDPSVASMGMIVPMLLSDGTMQVVQVVDPGSNTVTGLEFYMDATVNGSMLDASLTEPIVVNLDFTVQLSDINADFTFEAPANATIMPTGGS